MVAGVVRDEGGAPLEGARVYFTDAPTPLPDVAALTGVDGAFALSTPVEGSYTLECRADGFAVRLATVDSRDPAPLAITLRPEH